MNIVFHKDFEKQVKKSPAGIRVKIKEKITLFRDDQFNIVLNNHALQGKFTGYRSINVTGDIRMIYKMLDLETAFFVKLGSHSKLYS